MSEFISWLLESSIPSIRYLTLRDLLHYPNDHPELQTARADIMKTGPVPAILARQTETGAWEGDRSYYALKYVSAHWNMLLLGELCADASDPRIQRGVEHMLNDTQQRVAHELKDGTTDFSCLWGNILRYASQFGYADDPRIEPMLAYQLRALEHGRCACAHNGHTACSWGVIRSLWGIALLPEPLHTPQLKAAIEMAVAFILQDFALEEANYPLAEGSEIHPLWFRLSFPLFYQTDILFTLRVLAEVGALSHPGAHPALDWLESLRDSHGRWHGCNPYRGRTWKEIGDRSEIDRWISLQAATVMMQVGRLESAVA